jgi:hypothetical protein
MNHQRRDQSTVFDQLRELQTKYEQQRQLAARERQRADVLERRARLLEASHAAAWKVSERGRPPPKVDAPIARALPVTNDAFTAGALIPGRRRSK